MKPERLSPVFPRVVLAAIVAVMAGCADRAPRSLVVVSIDTLRADRLGCYGNPRGLSPNLDRLAGTGLLFEDVTAPTPITLPSHASLFTGRYPTAHGVRNNGSFVLPEDETTLAELLQSEGWRTAAVVAAFPLIRRYGLAQGFQRYDDALPEMGLTDQRGMPTHFPERDAATVTDRALEIWNEMGSGQRFLWVHYFDPHAPYAPPEPYGGDSPVDRYEGEVAFTDAHMGRLLDTVRAEDPNAIVAVVADHGEGLEEHGEKTHGVFLYQSTLSVPLVLSAPDVLPAGKRVAAPVSLVDLMPTLLSLLDIETPAGLHGVDLRRLIDDGSDAERPVYAESYVPLLEYRFSELRALRRGSLKYIDAPLPELYDLAEDPGEARNLSAGHSASEAIEEDLRAFVDREDREASERAGAVLDPESEAKLRSLGYLAGGGGLEAADPEQTRRDPKQMGDYFRRYDRAVGMISTGNFEEGIAELRALEARAPENYMARYHIAVGLTSMGRYDEAEDELARVISAAPELANLHQAMADVQLALGKLDAAAESYRAAAAAAPEFSDPHFALGNLLASRGRHQEAVEAIKEAIERAPDRSRYANRLLGLYLARDAVDTATSEFRALTERHPSSAALWTARAILSRRSGDSGRALEQLRTALALDGRNYDALVEIGEIRLESGEPDLADRAFRRAIAVRAEGRDAHFGLARLLLSQGRLPEADAALAKVLRIDPDFSHAHTVRGLYLEQQGDSRGAALAFQRALRLDGSDRAARAGLQRVTSHP